MQAFAHLLDSLSTTPSRTGKLALLKDYFRSTPDPARGYALAALTDGLFPRLPLRRALLDLMSRHIDPVLYQLSRDYVGDTAETVALLWPDRPDPVAPPLLDEVVDLIARTPRDEIAPTLGAVLDRLDVRGRWAFLKLLGGAARVGVSARLAKTALAELNGIEVSEIEEVWHALAPPYLALFDWLEGRGKKPDASGLPVFRPLMLAHPIAEADWQGLAPEDVVAEWKWDGIRTQISAKAGEVRLFSRTGDDISATFPEIAAAFQPFDLVADGELLIVRQGAVAPFNDLQQRLNRKSVTGKMMRESPAHVRLYDFLFEGDEDLRPRPFLERRDRLSLWMDRHKPPLADLSPLVDFTSFADLESLWGAMRQAGIEGLMLKRKASPYLSGRPRGHWFKWKRAPQTLDCVLMYAQRGSGKRSSLYSDYTFGVWRPAAATSTGAEASSLPGFELVPIGKAYSGFTDSELVRLDKFIRSHTLEQFGPVRSIAHKLVLEIEFDEIFRSTRHKSGLAMRFPRIHRIRWDKPAPEANTLEDAERLLRDLDHRR